MAKAIPCPKGDSSPPYSLGYTPSDGARNIILINDAFCEMFGLPPNSDAFLGASGNSLFTNIQSNFQEPTEFLKRIRGYYTSMKMELNKEVLMQDGRICELDYIPIDVDGTFSGHLWHYRDITIRKQNEQKLIETNKILQGLSSVDGLTGIANRRTFDERLQAEWTRGIRNSSNNKPLSLIMFDIDHFKLYNDTYGHLQGDLCLKQIAEALKKSTKRPGDLAARYGGEEFAVILPETDEQGALLVAEEIRKSIENLKIPHTASLVSDIVTVSVGVSSIFPKKEISEKDIVACTDKALYRSKNTGRNRVTVYNDQFISQ